MHDQARAAAPQPAAISVRRCPWCEPHPEYIAYHDLEWGVPEHDERALFEKLILDGFQAGLSWLIILRKRDAFRAAFDGFEPDRIARYDARKLAALQADPGIVRNRAKIEATVTSARAFLALRDAGQNFDTWLWRFTQGRTIRNRWHRIEDLPTESAASRAMAKTLRQHGFKFCGPTICYAFMQAVGMVNDHLTACFRYTQL